MPEAVRLVIWDLDETFWKGTLTEGGIREYLQANHDIVIELARRGIMSSICSKNDRETVQAILDERGISDYFIFPSINWESKGLRVKAIVEAARLRPATVLFIDDNPGNRAEVAALVPFIQTADETFAAQMLASPLFRGKDDRALTRLAEYKLLEKRHADEIRSGGDNRAFLRNSNIRVGIETDIAKHVDRAVELINRTNQLNFTKARLPDEPGLAAKTLLREIAAPDRRAGLVRVVDNYGDYGFVGFFLIGGAGSEASLIHYCFSCRTLGMAVESWLYDRLGRPRLTIVGEVLADLNSGETIDWIASAEEEPKASPAPGTKRPEIRIFGGGDANFLALCLGEQGRDAQVTANFRSGNLLVRMNSSAMLLSAADRSGTEFSAEMERFGLPVDRMTTSFFDPLPTGGVLIASLQLDSGYLAYRHKRHGWKIKIEPMNFWDDLTSVTDEEIAKYVSDSGLSEAEASRLQAIVAHLRESYVSFRGPAEKRLFANMHAIFDRAPLGCKLVIVAPGKRIRENGVLQSPDWVGRYHERLHGACAGTPFVSIVSADDFLRSDDEIEAGWNNYDRALYARLARGVIEAAENTPAKTAAHRKKFPEIRMVGGCEANSIAPYLNEHARLVRVSANFASGDLFVRVNGSTVLLSASERRASEFTAEMQRLGLPVEKMTSSPFDYAKPGSVLILSLQLDAGHITYQHKRHGWALKIEPPDYWGDLCKMTDSDILEYAASRASSDGDIARLRAIVAHMRENYVSVHEPDEAKLSANMQKIFDRAPVGCKLVILQPGERVRENGVVKSVAKIAAYNERLERLCAPVPFVSLVRVDDFVHSDEEIVQGWNHYERVVYFRLAQALVDAAERTSRKEARSEAA